MNRFIIADPGRCIGCGTCVAACSSVHRAAGLQAQPRLTIVRTMSVTAPVLCRHCDDAPCARVCPVEAIVIGGGRVQLDEARCIGCKMCALACPFGAIAPGGTPVSGVGGSPVDHGAGSAALDPLLAWEIGVKSVAVKCDLCASLSGGPECVRVCPTAALHLQAESSLTAETQTRRIAAATAAPNPSAERPTS